MEILKIIIFIFLIRWFFLIGKMFNKIIKNLFILLISILLLNLSGCATISTSDGKWIKYRGIMPGEGKIADMEIKLNPFPELPPIEIEQ